MASIFIFLFILVVVLISWFIGWWDEQCDLKFIKNIRPGDEFMLIDPTLPEDVNPFDNPVEPYIVEVLEIRFNEKNIPFIKYKTKEGEELIKKVKYFLKIYRALNENEIHERGKRKLL